MKVKAKPLYPRKEKTKFELKTTLNSFKRRKVEDERPQFNIPPNFNLAEATKALKDRQGDSTMAPVPNTE